MLHDREKVALTFMHYESEAPGSGEHKQEYHPDDGARAVHPKGTLITGHHGGLTAALMMSRQGRAITGSTDATVKVQS
jgi:hypothetical protein